MIYQLTPFSKNLREPFSPLYQNFVMEEDPFISSEFPNAQIRKSLVEYLGLYYCWKKKKHDWIGFTSYRQMDKCTLVLDDEKMIRDLLSKIDIITWMQLDLGNHLAYACARHPKLLTLLNKLELKFPRKGQFVYCNYFIMSWDNFDAYMKWSWPFVKKMINMAEDPCLNLKAGHYSNLGVMVERLFIIWHIENKKLVWDLYPEATYDFRQKESAAPFDYRCKSWLKELYFKIF